MSCEVRVFCLPYHNTGGHFIDWSINFVCGRGVSVIPPQLSAVKNWHHHTVHVGQGSKLLADKIKELQDATNDFATVCFNTLPISHAVKELFDIKFEHANPKQVLAVEEYIANDYRAGIRFCQDHDMIPVFFDYQPGDFYSIYYNDRYPQDWNQQHHQSRRDLQEQYHKTFFADSVDRFSSAIWDQRELAALTYRPYGALSVEIDYLIDQSLPHLYYSTDDAWNGFEHCLEEICHAWNLDIDQDRMNIWQNIYAQWRTVHDPWFGRHLARIVDAVINNKYLSLRRFRMNFFMEVILQHELMAKYNLNLKTWQLDRFPDNTQELHQLLEQNIHVI